MPPRQYLVDFVEEQRKRGVHADRIRGALLELGHQTEHIEEALSYVSARRRKTFLIVFAVLLMLTGISFVVYESLRENESHAGDASGREVTQGNVPLDMPSDDDRSVFREAVNTRSPELCSSIQSEDLKVQCFSYSNR